MFKAPLIACTIAASLGCSAQSADFVPNPKAAGLAQSLMLAPSRCAPPSVHDGRALVPDKVVWMVGTDVSAVMKSALGSDIRAAIGGSPEIADAVAALTKCGLDPSKIDRITLAGDASDGAMGVIEVPGVGTDATLDCLHDAAKATTGRSPWTKTTKACTTSLQIDGGATVAYVADADTLVFASAKLDAGVRDRLAGRGTPATSGVMGWVAGAVDLKQAVWFAMDVPSSLASSLPVGGLTRLGGSIDPSKGLGLDVIAGFATTQEAKEAHGQMSLIPTMGPMLGLPSKLTDSIAIDRKGDSVSVELFVSPADLAELKRVAGIGGGPTGGAPAGKSRAAGI